MPVDHTNNLTLRILHAAHEGKYAINAQSCYDVQSVIALVRAAEASRSPALCQLFPVTMAQFGKPFLQFCLDTCHSASVPISVHLDHAASDEDITRALDWAEQGVALDSIMIDCSHFDTDEENIAMAKPYVERANKLGMAVEVELGRLAGGEAGVRVIEEGMLTKPEKAERFLTELGAQMLAPSIGNIHGRYVNEPQFRLDLLEELQKTVGPGTKSNAYIVLHGTDDLKDELFRDCTKRGAYKINVNSWARDPQVEYWSKHLEKDPLPEVYEGGMDEFGKVCKRFFDLFESSGKA
ncbi:putative Fructose-bisphosphate aldolase (putative) [Pseudozyma hubeiensis]|nr:putative Fructose-bisphosphate aldolase (putative) [Pseudozyma hubeiensis]